MAINIIADKCKACGICVKECPFEAMTMTEAYQDLVTFQH